MFRSLCTISLALAACGGSSPASPPPVAPSPAADAPAPAPAAAGRFHYDAASGACVDDDGKPGLNQADPAALFGKGDEASNTYESGDGECVDFTGFDFNAHIGSGYPKLSKWNFRGAKFTKARFLFANMTEVDLSGADLSELELGYTTIDGTSDAHTKRHPTACTEPEANQLYCRR